MHLIEKSSFSGSDAFLHGGSSNPVFVKKEERNRLVENMIRIVFLDPKTSNAPLAVKAGFFEGQICILCTEKQ
jgi:hypothetical protein